MLATSGVGSLTTGTRRWTHAVCGAVLCSARCTAPGPPCLPHRLAARARCGSVKIRNYIPLPTRARRQVSQKSSLHLCGVYRRCKHTATVFLTRDSVQMSTTAQQEAASSRSRAFPPLSSSVRSTEAARCTAHEREPAELAREFLVAGLVTASSEAWVSTNLNESTSLLSWPCSPGLVTRACR